jgi:hypothetical protein
VVVVVLEAEFSAEAVAVAVLAGGADGAREGGGQEGRDGRTVGLVVEVDVAHWDVGVLDSVVVWWRLFGHRLGCGLAVREGGGTAFAALRVEHDALSARHARRNTTAAQGLCPTAMVAIWCEAAPSMMLMLRAIFAQSIVQHYCDTNENEAA